MKTFKDIDEYIAKADKTHREVLAQVREVVLDCVPDAAEGIAYGMPAFKWQGQPLFYFAAMKGHLGLYPTSGPIAELGDKLKDYSTSKGCVRVPYGKELPKKIIIALLKTRMKEIKSSK